MFIPVSTEQRPDAVPLSGSARPKVYIRQTVCGVNEYVEYGGIANAISVVLHRVALLRGTM